MAVEQLHQSTTTCPECGAVALSTPWRPEAGLDLNMREFECLNFHHTFYKVIPGARNRELKKKQKLI